MMWLWIAAGFLAGLSVGFMLCAMFTVSKAADETTETYWTGYQEGKKSMADLVRSSLTSEGGRRDNNGDEDNGHKPAT